MVDVSNVRAWLLPPLLALALSCLPAGVAEAETAAAALAGATILDEPAPPVRATLELEVLMTGDRDRMTLRFALPRAGIVRITLSTLDGREVGTLASGLSAAGENRIDIDVKKIPPGEYRITLQSRDGNASTRLVIAR